MWAERAVSSSGAGARESLGDRTPQVPSRKSMWTIFKVFGATWPGSNPQPPSLVLRGDALPLGHRAGCGDLARLPLTRDVLGRAGNTWRTSWILSAHPAIRKQCGRILAGQLSQCVRYLTPWCWQFVLCVTAARAYFESWPEKLHSANAALCHQFYSSFIWTEFRGTARTLMGFSLVAWELSQTW